MKTSALQLLLETLASGNPENLILNHNGLNELGKILFYPATPAQDKRSLELKALIEQYYPTEHKKILASLRTYHFSSFYTDKNLIAEQIAFLKNNSFEPRTILEPSAGNGAYVLALAQAYPKAIVTALEPDFLTYLSLRSSTKHLPNIICNNTTFETFTLTNQNKFDLVVSNIPFGQLQIENAFLHKNITSNKEKNINVYMNRFLPDLVNDKGISMIITSKQFLDSDNYNDLRLKILDNNTLLEAVRFDNLLFAEEKTKVVTDLIIYQKDENKQSKTAKEILFSQTQNIELPIDENQSDFFSINSYLFQNPALINGTIQAAHFHSRMDLTVINNGTNNSNHLNLLLQNKKIDQNISYSTPSLQDAIVNSLVGSTAQKYIEKPTIAIEKLPYEEGNRTTVHPEHNHVLTVHDLINKDTSYFKDTYHYKNNQLYFHKDEFTYTAISNKEQLKHYDLYTNYIELKNSYYLFIENIKQNRYTPEQLKTEFGKLENVYNMFAFRYDSLHSKIEVLKGDYYLTTLRNKIETVENRKISINPNFNANYYLSFLEQKEEIKQNNPSITIAQPQANNSAELEILTKFEKVTFSKDDSLPTNIYKYYDNNGKIDIDIIANIYSKTSQQIAEEAFKENIACFNPKFNNDNTFTHYEFELFPNLISGSLDAKIEALSNHALPLNIDSNIYIKTLEANKNEKLSIDDIEFNFESQYISPQIKTEFFYDLIGERVEVINGKSDSSVTLLFRNNNNHDAHTRYAITPSEELGIHGKLSYKDMFQCFATNTFPQVTYSTQKANGDTERKIDVKGTMHAINIYEQLHLEFKAFITSNQIYTSQIENNYYNLFLSEKNLKLGPEAITAPSTFTRTPYKHQLEGVAFALNNGTALIDHTVGQGKTLTMSLLAYKLIQHKKAGRVFITTEKTVAADFAKALEENFPTLNVIRLDTNTNFSSNKRDRTLQSIVGSNIDIIIGENSHIPYILKSDDAIKSIYDKNVAMIEQDLENAKRIGGISKETKNIIQGLEKRKNTLASALNENIHKNQQNTSGVTLESLNIDALIIDEAHNFKNIQYTTRHDDVAGLNSSKVTTKNFDLETTIHSIHMRKGADQNVFFFSGTPIINSVTELYAYQRYLTPHFLEQKNILNFDSWASNFLRQSIQAESDIFGNAKMHKRFRYFTNIPELSKMYHSFTHISDESTFNTHNFKLNDKFIELETCDEFEDLKTKSIAFAKEKNQIDLFGYEKYDQKSMKASFVTALTLNRKALIDPMSVKDTTCHFDESHQYKLRQLITDAHGFYTKTDEHKGVVLIFTDMNTWSKDDPTNTCSTMKDILIKEYGIDPSKIGIAQEYIQKKKNDEFQEKIRNGEIRFAIGSTTSMGTGTNIQKKIVAIFALDIPYTPHAELQRLGRMLRSGNEILQHYNNTGYYYSYGVKDTTDIFSYSLNKHKQKFIKQLKSEVHKSRTFDDVYTDITQVSAAQKEQMLIGDTESFSLVKLKEDLKQIETQKHFFDIKQNNAVKKIDRFENDIKENIQKVLHYNKTQDIITNLLPSKEVLSNGTAAERKEEILKLYTGLKSISDNLQGSFENYTISDYAKYIESGISLMYQGQSNKELIRYNIDKNVTLSYCYNKIALNKSTDVGFFSVEIKIDTKKVILKGPTRNKFDMENTPFHLNTLLQSIPGKIKDISWEIDMTKKSIDSNTKILNTTFPPEKIKQLHALKNDVQILEKKINKRKL